MTRVQRDNARAAAFQAAKAASASHHPPTTSPPPASTPAGPDVDPPPPTPATPTVVEDVQNVQDVVQELPPPPLAPQAPPVSPAPPSVGQDQPLDLPQPRHPRDGIPGPEFWEYSLRMQRQYEDAARVQLVVEDRLRDRASQPLPCPRL